MGDSGQPISVAQQHISSDKQLSYLINNVSPRSTCLHKIQNVFTQNLKIFYLQNIQMQLLNGIPLCDSVTKCSNIHNSTNNQNLVQSVSMFKSKLCMQFYFLSKLFNISLSSEKTLCRIQCRHHLLSRTIFCNYCNKNNITYCKKQS
jgi:hypothetical protein